VFRTDRAVAKWQETLDDNAQKLAASEQRFRDVSDAAGEYLWEIDANMVYTYVSNRSVDVKGYSPEELLGHTPMEFMGIKIENKVAQSHRLFGDRQLYYEVIRNLMANAVKFCRKGDSITLFVPEERPGVLAVSDTGVGIKPERMQNLFKYEVKTSTPGTEGEPGTGLGLPLSCDLMKAQGGTLVVESKPGGGSTFFVQLPHVKPLVLAVDANPIARRLLVDCIQPLDVELREAESGKAAMEVLEQGIPHLIITDLNTSEMGGFDLIKHIKSEPKTRNIPIIVLMSDIDTKAQQKVIGSGADDLATKPVTRETLEPRIRRFIT
jgi:CheY-like chemotaxis protein